MIGKQDLMWEMENCPVKATLELIGGKWKCMILYLISLEINRFGKISMVLKDVSKQMLTTQLRELEADGLIERIIYPEIPPRVEYFLTEKGKSLQPLMNQLKEWGMENIISKRAEAA